MSLVDHIIPMLFVMMHEYSVMPHFYVNYYMLYNTIDSPIFFVFLILFFLVIKNPIKRMIMI